MNTGQQAYNDPHEWDPSLSKDKPKGKTNGGSHHANEKPSRRYQLLTAAELAAIPIPPDRVQDVFPVNGVAAAFGEFSTGKSFLLEDLAYKLSDSLPWFGKRVTPCDVLYIALEGGKAGQARRAQAYRDRHGAQAGARVRFIVEPFSLLYPDDEAALIATILEHKINGGVIILDTLSAATPGMKENEGEGMGLAIAAAVRIREACGGLVILVHHAGKDLTRGMRGHSSLSGALDSIIEVTRNKSQNTRSWKLFKGRDMQDGESHDFRLEVVHLGVNEHGDPVTSCVVSEDGQQATGAAKPPTKLPKGVKIALKALQEAIDAHGEVMPESSTIPKGMRAVRLEQWRERFTLRYGSEGGSEKKSGNTSRAAFRRAKEKLLEAGLVGISDPWCWQWTAGQ